MRLIRTEYITGLEQIVAFDPQPVISVESMQAMQKVIMVIASEELAVLVEENPPTVILDQTYRNIYPRTDIPKVIEDEMKRWNKIWNELERVISDRSFSYYRASQSLANVQEHARVQLAWAKDLSTSTVNITRDDHQKYLAGLQHVNNEK